MLETIQVEQKFPAGYHGCWRLSVAGANLTAGSRIASRSALYN